MIKTIDVIKDYFKPYKHEVYEAGDDEYIVLCDKKLKIGDANIHILPFSDRETIKLQYKEVYSQKKGDKGDSLVDIIDLLTYQYVVAIATIANMKNVTSWRTPADEQYFYLIIDTNSGYFMTKILTEHEMFFSSIKVDKTIPKKTMPIEFLLHLI